MRNVKSVVVERVAFHELSRSKQGAVKLRLSDIALEFEPQVDGHDPDPVEGYLTEHVHRSLGDALAVAASFDDPQLPTPYAIGRLFDDDEFLDASQDVARQLLGALEADGRISPGTIAVIQYVPDNGNRCIGLVKFDPSLGFTLAEKRVKEKVGLTLSSVNGVMPSVRERLQKCAFVRQPAGGDTYQLLALDRQGRADEIADWFLHRFLTATAVATAETRTQSFYRAAALARQDVAPDLTEAQKRGLDAARDQALRDKRISTGTFIDNRDELPTEEIRSRYREVFESAITDKEFDVDRSTADRLLKRAKFVGDGGLTLQVDLDDIERVGVLERDPILNRTFVRLWTETWDRK